MPGTRDLATNAVIAWTTECYGLAVEQKTCWRTPATTVTFPEAVQETEEVAPVNAVSTWVLPSRVMVGR